MSSPIIRAQEIANILDVSISTAQRIVKQFSDELKEQGFFVQAGRLPRKYFYERTSLEPEATHENT